MDARTEYLMAKQRGDAEATKAAQTKLLQLGVKAGTINKLVPGGGVQYMFQRLPESQQESLLRSMPPEKFKQFYPKASRATKADPDVRDMARKYYGANP